MIIIGLTGSIATGKTFVAQCFAKLGAKIFNADKIVHEVLDYQGEAVEIVRNEFPEAYDNGRICRKKLGNLIFTDDNKRKILENIIHPMVLKAHQNFIDEAKKKKEDLVVLEIPLLFEAKLNIVFDYVIVTTAPLAIQKDRALQREGMTIEKFNAINNLQMNNAEKSKHADFIIDTKISEFSVFEKVKEIIQYVRSQCEK